MKNTLLIFGFISTFFLFGCKNDDSTTSSYKNTGYYEQEETDKSYNTTEVYDYEDEPGVDGYTDIETTDELSITEEEINIIGKKIIKNADVSLEVEDYVRDISQIKDTLKYFNCEITNENESNYDEYISNTLIIRVKSSQFDSLMAAILSGEGKITSKHIYINDVTEQYIDVYQRLKNKKSIETQYLELLKKAYTINDILNVTEYLRRIQEEIESNEGRLKYMDDQSSYSTITLNISYTGETIAYKETFLDKILKGINAGWDGIVYMIIALFYLWPLWILLVIITFVVRKQIKNQKLRNNKQK